MQHELLRFAQEAISNAVRHAKATVVSVALRWESPNLILQVKDNGSGISKASLEKSEGFGLRNICAPGPHKSTENWISQLMPVMEPASS
jgi:signal transduction histidine kinase